MYLPRMTLMQTCLMCWSVGALPWDRKDKSQFVHRTTKRTLFNGKPTGWARKQVAGTRRAGPVLLRSWGLALPPRSLPWDGVSKGKPQGLPSTHGRALDPRQAGGALFSLHASRARGSLWSFHPRKPPASFRSPQARLPGATCLEHKGTLLVQARHKECVCFMLIQALPWNCGFTYVPSPKPCLLRAYKASR